MSDKKTPKPTTLKCDVCGKSFTCPYPKVAVGMHKALMHNPKGKYQLYLARKRVEIKAREKAQAEEKAKRKAEKQALIKKREALVKAKE